MYVLCMLILVYVLEKEREGMRKGKEWGGGVTYNNNWDFQADWPKICLPPRFWSWTVRTWRRVQVWAGLMTNFWIFSAIMTNLKTVRWVVVMGFYIHRSSNNLLSDFLDANGHDILIIQDQVWNMSSSLVSIYCLECMQEATLSRTSNESENKALANAMTELIWVESILHELGIKQGFPLLFWHANIRATYLLWSNKTH